MRVIRAIRQRFADFRRERRINRLRLAAVAAIERDGVAAAAPQCIALFDECDRRSPEQKARMERAHLAQLDPHARAVYERRA